MHVLPGFAVLLLCAWLLSRAVGDARASSWAGPRTPAMRSRAAVPRPARGRGRAVLRSAGGAAGSAASAVLRPGSGAVRAQAKADVHRLWQETFAADWLEQRRHVRAGGTGGGAVAAAAARPARYACTCGAVYAAPQELAACRRGHAQAAPAVSAAAAGNGNGGPPARPVPPPPAQPTSSNGGMPVSGSGQPSYEGGDFGKVRYGSGGIPVAGTTAGAEQLIEGYNRIHAEAAAGGIHAKQAAVKAAGEGCVRGSATAQMLARTWSEPASNYGPEVTEPLGKAAQYLQAAAMAFGESDSALSSLIHMTVGELAASPRQAPHHSELSEGGAR